MRQMTSVRLALLALAIVLLAGAVWLTVARPGAAPAPGRLAWVVQRGPNTVIYLVDLAGGAPTPLAPATPPTPDLRPPPPGTQPPLDPPEPGVQDLDPAWAPDGQRLSFTSTRAGGYAIFVVNADGSGLQRISPPGARAGWPAWSPDGRRIAFQMAHDRVTDLYLYDLTGGPGRLITGAGGAPPTMMEGAAAWAPDGARLVYHAAPDGELYVIAADGSHAQQLTRGLPAILTPAWSPDGRRIAFAAARDQNTDIYAMNSDGSAVTRLTDAPQFDVGPAWSGDGRRILFASDRDGAYALYTMNADGSDQHPLRPDLPRGVQPALWAPRP